MDNIQDLIKKWEGVLDEGTKIRSAKILKSTAIMLENQHNIMLETTGYATGADSLGANTYSTSQYLWLEELFQN